MVTRDDLRRLLINLDGKGYPAYRDLRGRYTFPGFDLSIDHIQPDPFAPPSRMRVFVPATVAAFPSELYSNRGRAVALRDYLARRYADACQELARQRPAIAIDRPGQEILERTAILIDRGQIEARFTVALPAAGRRILGRQAADILCIALPQMVERALLYKNQSRTALDQHVETVEDADALRAQLRARRLVAFVADGAILPRRSGVDDRPLDQGAVPFRAPDRLRVTLDRPNAGPITGMGIPEGVSLIVGGGFHGKSTLLQALQRGIYNHMPGDGREFVVADEAAVKIRAEDGRSVACVDISPFINNLPFGKDTHCFTTENASGSTSQAANIIEALEAGARLLLVDEDTSATNFMIRDHRMQELIAKDREPITPFIDKVHQLYADYGVSTILVMGGSGDYFDVADTVIAMENYLPRDVTAEARSIARKYAAERRSEGGDRFGPLTPRTPDPASIDPSRGRREVSLKARGLRALAFGRAEIDLAAVEQLVDDGQVRAIGHALNYARDRCMDHQEALAQILDRVMADLDSSGLDAFTPWPVGDLAHFRRFELAAALNRLRGLRMS